MNYEKNIFCISVLKYYFAKNFGFHYPLELIGPIMKFCYADEWTEIFYDSDLSGTKCIDEFKGLYVDQIMLKFVLPELPNGLVYKKFCIYDLIHNITIRI